MTSPLILAIESSCDETSAAVLRGREVLSNLIATQKIHERFGGVVPELASRAHQANIVPVVSQALQEAGVEVNDLDAIAVTQGPGLMGALLVGFSFAKSMSLALNKPLLGVNHMRAHVLAHFALDAREDYEEPEFPLLCLTVSGGHTQLVLVKSPTDMSIVGETIDDAAGEAFDKAAKVLGLEYPGGPLVDKHAQLGNPKRFKFTKPQTPGLTYSFSGLKTNLLYFLKEEKAKNEHFISENLSDLCASYQHHIVEYLLSKMVAAAEQYGVSHVALAGGVSANSELRARLLEVAASKKWKAHIPPFSYCTDNAAMIGVAGYYQLMAEEFTLLSALPKARWEI
jgi:N6-L-threonylcarbamoyladenine synthase